MENVIKNRIAAVVAEMQKAGIDAVIVPLTDPHQSEYVADHWQLLRYLSGFTGSAATLVVTSRGALLWTDSRYFIQAASQLEGSGIALMKDGLPDTPSVFKYLDSAFPDGYTLGVDKSLFSMQTYARDIEPAGNSARKVVDFDIADIVWPDRPALPEGRVFVHDVKYAGESASGKIAGIIDFVRGIGADMAFISALDEIAWTLNIRCDDVMYNPVATAYLLVAPGDSSVLFIDPGKVDGAVMSYLRSQGVGVRPYDMECILEYFDGLCGGEVSVYADPASTSAFIIGQLADRGLAVNGCRAGSPVAMAKACRNDVQIEGTRRAMVRDGVAMVKAFKALDDMIASGMTVTELTVGQLLHRYRSEQPLFFDESFATIAGYGPHGAIVHYEADENSASVIGSSGLLLVDSGAQYLDGTTDITRTIAMGDPTPGEIHDFTLVMMGHIDLAMMVFPVGTRGAQLDVEARKYLWREGKGFLHGTGHGVGHFLNVHEGPQSIRLNDNPVPLTPGMVTSNEPGLYLEGRYGIRCENLMLCVKAMTTDFAEFLSFETLTLFPFDLRLFDTSMMTPAQIAWVNAYHRTVRERLSPHLDDAHRKWLSEKTAPLV